ncbi:uncharacterized protein [Argopecten irradians]|uniref:uncharacterized protein n=1 Tax=Argopecten irradians TaxID=31199 RepID=UPI0037122405
MGFPQKPEELEITEMEERLISPRIPFMQLCEKPRGGQRSLRGNIVNVPTDVQSTVKILPRTLADSETIQVKLKRRLSNKHSVLYQSIRPNKCLAALKWLISNSIIFQAEGIQINDNWILGNDRDWYGHDNVNSTNTDHDLEHNFISLENRNSIQSCETNEDVSRNTYSTFTDHHIFPMKGGDKKPSNQQDNYQENVKDLPVDRVIELCNQHEKIVKDMEIDERTSQHCHDGNDLLNDRKDEVPFHKPANIGQRLTADIVSESSLIQENEQCCDLDDSDGWTEVNHFDDRFTGNTDTLLHPVDVQTLNSKIMSFAPGEGQTPLGLYQDKDAEYLSFPTIYCGQRRPENKERKTPVHYSTICKWELRCQDRRAAVSIPNLFYKMKKLQIKQLQDKVSLAMRKCKTNHKITAKEVLSPSSFDNVVRHNDGYRVLRTLRGSPAYWEQAKKDVFAMIRQLGIPTWFCSFSAAETKWLVLLRILGTFVHNKAYTDEELESLSWKDKCELIKSDPVMYARYFNHRVQVFISSVLKGEMSPLGSIKDFFYRVEFQQRGSPHIHMLLWIENAPIFGISSKETIENFIDEHSTCTKQSERQDLINYQTHRHARTCRKKGKAICRFGYPIPPMLKTSILEPLSEEECTEFPKAAANYIKISEMLDTMTLGEDITFQDFLEHLEMDNETYVTAIRSSLTAPKVFLKRNPSEVRINSYNRLLLEAWEANMDVQFILDAYSCASYIVSYISKGERGMSNLLHQACQEIKEGNHDIKQQVRHIGNKFLTHVEVCAQEAAYLVLQMPLRHCSRSVVFINTSEEANRTFLLKPLKELEDLPEHSTDIESDNNIKRYQRRPKALQQCCLAEFFSKFDTLFPKKSSKTLLKQAEVVLPEDIEDLDEEIICNEGTEKDSVDETTTLDEYVMKNGSVLKRRKTSKILRYIRYNRALDQKNFFREQLMLFLPWRDETKDLLGKFHTYEESHAYHIDVIHNNKGKIEAPNADIIESVEDNIQQFSNEDIAVTESQHIEEIHGQETSVPSAYYGCFNPSENQKRYDLASDFGISRKQLDTEETFVNDISNEEYLNLVKTLNKKQRLFFDHVLHWFKTEQAPLYCFLTGGAGVGKSVVTTALYQAVTRYFAKCLADSPNDIKAVLCAPTGKAAHNIGGRTIHSLFCIPANQGFKYKPLDSQQLDTLRVKLNSLKVIFIDEISMVGNRMFNYINMRLQQIFATTVAFGGVSVIAIGDLFQLKPVMDCWIFEDMKEDYGAIGSNLWKDNFQIFELSEIMRQREDGEFALLLNRLREGSQTAEDIMALANRKVLDPAKVTEKPHLFTTNAKVNEHNTVAFENAPAENKCTIKAIDSVSGDVADNVKSRIMSQIPDNPSKTMGLFETLQIVQYLPVEICVNVDVDDGLTNGAVAEVKMLDFRVPESARCSIIWVLFTEPKIGSKARMTYNHLYTQDICKSWTPILEITKKFSVGRNHACFITRRQFPLRLAAAKTVHKSQGSTMDTAVLHFGTRRQEHMHYVGLSRVRKLQDVHILHLNENKIAVSKEVMHEMSRMRQSAPLHSCVPILEQIHTDLKIVYHNVRSLHKHICDVRNTSNVLSADIIAISECRLTSVDDDVAYELPGFDMYRFDDMGTANGRPHKGMVLYSRIALNNVQACTLLGVETVSAEILHKESIVQLVFLYNPPSNASAKTFIAFLRHILQIVNGDTKLVIIGDTNIHTGTMPECLKEFLVRNNLSQVMHSITTDYHSCLDHVYIKGLPSNEISCATLESHYSDHKPIIAYLPF